MPSAFYMWLVPGRDAPFCSPPVFLFWVDRLVSWLVNRLVDRVAYFNLANQRISPSSADLRVVLPSPTPIALSVPCPLCNNPNHTRHEQMTVQQREH